jgi:hypothetical protein
MLWVLFPGDNSGYFFQEITLVIFQVITLGTFPGDNSGYFFQEIALGTSSRTYM